MRSKYLILLIALIISSCNSNQVGYNIVCDGNSLTLGQGSEISYPEHLKKQLRSEIKCKVHNLGVGGQTTLDMLEDGEDELKRLYDDQSVNILFAWEIRNHLVQRCPTVEEAISAFEKYCNMARQMGYEVFVMTVLPSWASRYCSDDTKNGYHQLELDRSSANEYLKSSYSSFSDHLIDIASDPFIGRSGSNLSVDHSFSTRTRPEPNQYYTDGTHLSAEGYGLVASYCYNALMKSIATTPN